MVLRPVYADNFYCKVQCNFCCAKIANSKSHVGVETSCDFSAILMWFIAAMLQEFWTCSNVMQFHGDFWLKKWQPGIRRDALGGFLWRKITVDMANWLIELLIELWPKCPCLYRTSSNGLQEERQTTYSYGGNSEKPQRAVRGDFHWLMLKYKLNVILLCLHWALMSAVAMYNSDVFLYIHAVYLRVFHKSKK